MWSIEVAISIKMSVSFPPLLLPMRSDISKMFIGFANHSYNSFSLGMSHDGDKGQCTSTNSDTIMVPSYARVPVNMWSQCSRDNLTDFFE